LGQSMGFVATEAKQRPRFGLMTPRAAASAFGARA
jgi:hypothetical protein